MVYSVPGSRPGEEHSHLMMLADMAEDSGGIKDAAQLSLRSSDEANGE